MNDHLALLGSGALGIFFFICGVLNILDHFLVKMILFTGFVVLIIYVIYVTSKKKKEKNPPQ